MVTDDRRDLGVVVHVAEDPFADDRVLLHLTTLLKGERARLLQQPSRQPDLPDVVHEPAEMRELLFLAREPHPLRDVARIDRHRRRMSRRISVPRIKRRDQGGSERKVRTVRVAHSPSPKSLGSLTLLAVEQEEPLSRNRRNSEKRNAPGRNRRVRVSQDSNHRRLKRHAREHRRPDRPHRLEQDPVPESRARRAASAMSATRLDDERRGNCARRVPRNLRRVA